MKRNISRTLSFIVASVVFGGMVSGCNKNTSVTNSNSASTQKEVNYPIKTDVTLSYWCYYYGDSSFGNSIGDLPFGKELEKETGIKVKWIHPAKGAESEQFNLLLASGSLPDIIQTNWYKFPGGPEKAIADNIIAPLNDLISKDSPNLKKLLDSNKSVNKMVKTDAGKYYVYPYLRTLEADLPPVYQGPMVRKDWLSDLGLQIPTTIDEWEVMLKAFKDKKNAQSPFTTYSFVTGAPMNTSSLFMGAYGVMDDFYLKNGKVVYGPTQEGFKSYLTLMNSWYKQGLIDKDIFSVDQKTADAEMLSGKAGSTVGNLGGTLGKYIDTMKTKDPKYDVVGVPFPSLKKDEKTPMGHLGYIYGDSNGSAAISATSKNKDLAAQYLDYAYSRKGQLLYNFGIEGTSYTMVNGVPTYTDLITKNPKLPLAQAVTGYTNNNAANVIDPDEFKQYSLPYDQEKKAMDQWKLTDEAKYQIPPVTATQEESSELASVMNDVINYKQEMVVKFILGQEPLSNFDKYVAQINKLGIDKAVKIKEAAIARYNKR